MSNTTNSSVTGCPPCELCRCLDISAKFNVGYCKKSDQIHTLIDGEYQFTADTDDWERHKCEYQARIRMSGIPQGSSEREQFEFEGRCDGYSSGLVFSFPEVHLQTSVMSRLSHSVTGCYSDIQVEVELYSLSEATREERENAPPVTSCDEIFPTTCEDYVQVSRECGSDQPCYCSWSSEETDIIFTHELYSLSGGKLDDLTILDAIRLADRDHFDCTDLCKIPPCFRCGHMPAIKGTSWIDENLFSLSSYTISEFGYPMLLDVRVEYFLEKLVDGETIVGDTFYLDEFTLSAAGPNFPMSQREFGANRQRCLNGHITQEELDDGLSSLGLRIIPTEACECDCLYGCVESDVESDTGVYTLENTLNEQLIESENNYQNAEVVLGCEVNSATDGVEYWVKYDINLTNIVNNSFGHNCIYDISVKLKLDEQEHYTETFTEVDLVEMIDGLPTNPLHHSYTGYREDTTHSSVLTKKVVLENLTEEDLIMFESGYAPHAVFVICADKARQSTGDGHTTQEQIYEQDWNCPCCQEYEISEVQCESLECDKNIIMTMTDDTGELYFETGISASAEVCEGECPSAENLNVVANLECSGCVKFDIQGVIEITGEDLPVDHQVLFGESYPGEGFCADSRIGDLINASWDLNRRLEIKVATAEPVWAHVYQLTKWEVSNLPDDPTKTQIFLCIFADDFGSNNTYDVSETPIGVNSDHMYIKVEPSPHIIGSETVTSTTCFKWVGMTFQLPYKELPSDEWPTAEKTNWVTYDFVTRGSMNFTTDDCG